MDEMLAAVNEIESRFAALSATLEQSSRAAELLDRLDQTILAKAFRGELVPHDPAGQQMLEAVAV